MVLTSSPALLLICNERESQEKTNGRLCVRMCMCVRERVLSVTILSVIPKTKNPQMVAKMHKLVAGRIDLHCCAARCGSKKASGEIEELCCDNVKPLSEDTHTRSRLAFESNMKA